MFLMSNEDEFVKAIVLETEAPLHTATRQLLPAS